MSWGDKLHRRPRDPEQAGCQPGTFDTARARQLARLREAVGGASRSLAAGPRPPSTGPLERQRRSGSRAEGSQPVLEVESIAKRFGGLQALSDVSLRVHEGEVVGLIGPNGSGKTTTFNCISGIYAPDAGDIRFRDRSLLTLSRHARARLGIGRTFQQLQLCPSLSVEENVSFSAEAQLSTGGVLADALLLPGRFQAARRRREVAERAVSWLGLEEVARRPAASVPIGTGRLIELGRATGPAPPLLILDEPSSGLDPGETRGFGRHLVDAVEQGDEPVSILLVEHDMSLVMPICDYIYVLDFGRLIAEGTPEEVRRDERVRAAYLGSHAGLEAEAAALEKHERAVREDES